MNIILTVIHKAFDSIGTLFPHYNDDYRFQKALARVRKNLQNCRFLQGFDADMRLLPRYCLKCLQKRKRC